MTDSLSGEWTYRSFRHEAVVVRDGAVEGAPDLAVPWAPPGVLKAGIDETGAVDGTLAFGPQAVLAVAGRVTAAAPPVPAALELTAHGLGAVYRIKGFFVPDSDHIVGTVVCLAGDLAKQPVGTAGAFALFPAAA